MRFCWIAWTIVLGLLTGSAQALDRQDSVLRATLANGLRVVVVPDHLAPVVTTQLNYLVGSNDAPPGFPGTAHALEHMMFRGSDGLDKNQLVELSARLGGRYNASTTETVTKYTYTVPASDLALALQIEALRMRGLTISPEDWSKERGAIEQEVTRDLSNPFYNFTAQVQSILFANTPFEHDALGDRASFDKTDASLLRRFYDTWYVPNNAILVICGDVDPQAALAEVTRIFGAIPSRPVPAHPRTQPQPVQPQSLTLRTNFGTQIVALVFPMPGLGTADYAAADVLSDVLSSERGALNELVISGKALSARLVYTPKADVGFGMVMASLPASDDPDPLLAQLRRILDERSRAGVSPELVSAAKRQNLAQLAFQANSVQDLADSWSTALALQHMNAPEDLADAYRAVTLDDVNRLAKQVFNPAHTITAILTPQASGAPVSSGGFGAVEAPGEVPSRPVTLPAWAAAALATPHAPTSGANPFVEILPNGLTLIVQPEHVSQTVSVFGQVREVRAIEEPPGKEGVAALTRRMFDYGTEKHNRLAFQEALDDLSISLHAGPDFSLAALTPAFAKGMHLLAENMLHPAFPEQAFPTLRLQLQQHVAGQSQTSSFRFGRATLHAIVPPGDPSLRYPSPASIASLQLQDVRDYYHYAFRPDLTTLVVVGDVTVDEARQVVRDTFGAWMPGKPLPSIELPPCPPNHTASVRVPDPSAIQASVVMAEMLEVPVASADHYPLVLGNVILTRGFSSRLYQAMRVQGGYVYTLQGAFDWARTRTAYSISFGADPDKTNKLQRLVIGHLLDMQDSPVSDEELTRAKAEVMRVLAMRGASVNEIAAHYLRQTSLGLPLETPQVTAEHYLPITASEIRQAWTRWIRPQDLVHIVRGPAE